jgi:hypothetical protein
MVPCPPALVGSAHDVVRRRKEAAADRLQATLRNKRTMMNLTQHRLWALQEGMLHNIVMGRVLRSYTTLNATLEEGSGHVENPNPVPLDPDGAESWDETELD